MNEYQPQPGRAGTDDPESHDSHGAGISATTIVWGLVLLVVAGLAVLTALTPIALDPIITLGCLLIGAGVALVGFAAIGGRRNST